jgi:hypothetical protein
MKAVAVSIVFTAGKDLEKSLYNLIQERMVDVVGNKGNKKTKFICLHPGNSKKLLMVRTLKMFQWFCVSERDGQNV